MVTGDHGAYHGQTEVGDVCGRQVAEQHTMTGARDLLAHDRQIARGVTARQIVQLAKLQPTLGFEQPFDRIEVAVIGPESQVVDLGFDVLKAGHVFHPGDMQLDQLAVAAGVGEFLQTFPDRVLRARVCRRRQYHRRRFRPRRTEYRHHGRDPVVQREIQDVHPVPGRLDQPQPLVVLRVSVSRP